MTHRELFEKYVQRLKDEYLKFVVRQNSEETKAVVENIRKKTNGAFEGECATSTLLGVINEYDEQGRCVTPNPNWITSRVTLDGDVYVIVKHRWKAYIFLPNLQGDYTYLLHGNLYRQYENLLAIVDIAPDYIEDKPELYHDASFFESFEVFDDRLEHPWFGTCKIISENDDRTNITAVWQKNGNSRITNEIGTVHMPYMPVTRNEITVDAKTINTDFLVERETPDTIHSYVYKVVETQLKEQIQKEIQSRFAETEVPSETQLYTIKINENEN